MTELQIEDSITNEELKLSTWHKFVHYEIVFFILLIPISFLIFKAVDYFKGKSFQFSVGEILFVIIIILLAGLTYNFQKKRLKLSSIETTIDQNGVMEILERIGKNDNWHLSRRSKNLIIIKTHPSLLSGSWGEQIIMFFEKDRVLLNSICDPDNLSSVVSMGRNKKNIKLLIKEIEKNKIASSE